MVKEANPGFAGGIAKRSPIQRVAWQLKGAPPRKKDRLLSPMAAITESRNLRERVTDLMVNAGAEPEDARVYCVFAGPEAFAEIDPTTDPELSAVDVVHTPKLARLRVSDSLSDLQLASTFAGDVPIGFLIFVWDRKDWALNDPQKFLEPCIRPLIVEPRPGAATNPHAFVAFAMRSEYAKINDRLEKTAGVFPDDED